ncbi:putative F0F1-ATPase subunit [compost metagenome]
MKPDEKTDQRMDEAARRAVQREAQSRDDPEPSLGRRIGQIGVLGWAIVVPLLLGLFIGRWLDRLLGSGVLFAAALLFLGAALGLWSAWRWMHKQ